MRIGQSIRQHIIQQHRPVIPPAAVVVLDDDVPHSIRQQRHDLLFSGTEDPRFADDKNISHQKVSVNDPVAENMPLQVILNLLWYGRAKENGEGRLYHG